MQYSDSDKLVKAYRYFNAGNLVKAESFCQKVVKRHSDQPDALNMLAVIALTRRQYQRVIELERKAIAVRPKEALYHYNLGLAYLHLQQPWAALQAIREALRLKPDLGPAYSDLCYVLKELGEFEEAIEAGRTAARLEPNDAKAFSNLAVALDAWGDFDNSFESYKKAAVLAPDNTIILKNLGNAYMDMGDKQNAERCYREAIRLNPEYGEPQRHLTRLKKYSSPEDPDVDRIRHLLDTTALPDRERIELHFALGKVYDDCGTYEQAFEQYSLGNQLENKSYNFSPSQFAEQVSGLIDYFSHDFIAGNKSIGNSSEVPVFVVGMPRSGTTLVEQIIASHSRAFGAGELRWFASIEQNLPALLDTHEAYPQCLEFINHDKVEMLAQKYLDYLVKLSGGLDRVVDKLPENVLRIGFIKLLFPNARIVHCRRNPMDTALSIYTQLFKGSIHWSYDLFNIGAYYAQYQRIVQHWNSVFPEDVLEVEYEYLIENQEEVSHHLIGYIGLDWEPGCLEFHKTRRRVRTASNLQVNQPMYASSVGRWKRYEKHLGRFRDGVEAYSGGGDIKLQGMLPGAL